MQSVPTQVLELRHIHAPPAPEFWPPAPGWWLLAMVVLGVMVILVRWMAGVLRRRRRRRQLLGRLAELERQCDRVDASKVVADVSGLLRRVALTRFPRSRVAGLTGEAWLRFLDETGGGRNFTQGPGKVLAIGPYLPRVIINRDGLFRSARDWITANTGRGNDL